MKQNKPPGPDGIPPSFFKKFANILAKPIAAIFDKSIRTAIFPTSFKESVVKPIPKKGSDNHVDNYRPVSNLNIMAKLYESIIYNKISTHVFNYVSDQQHGFVKSKSTVTNLVEFTDFTARAIQNNIQVDVCYTDVQKCFDRISHDSIISKLISSGFSPPLVKLFVSYLQNRKVYVLYKKCKSQPFLPLRALFRVKNFKSHIHTHIQRPTRTRKTFSSSFICGRSKNL